MKIQLTATFVYEGCDNSKHAKELLNADLEAIPFPDFSTYSVNPRTVVLKL